MISELTVGQCSAGLLLTLIIAIPSYGFAKGIDTYQAFVGGAKGGMDVIFGIFPYLLGMLVAVGMLRDSGALDFIATLFTPIAQYVGYPKELLPLSLMRPFSGAASNALFFDIIDTYGAGSLLAFTAATMMAATETTFYVVSIYFGAVNITRTRYTLFCCLLGEAAGMIAAVIICRCLF